MLRTKPTTDLGRAMASPPGVVPSWPLNPFIYPTSMLSCTFLDSFSFPRDHKSADQYGRLASDMTKNLSLYSTCYCAHLKINVAISNYSYAGLCLELQSWKHEADKLWVIMILIGYLHFAIQGGCVNYVSKFAWYYCYIHSKIDVKSHILLHKLFYLPLLPFSIDFAYKSCSHSKHLFITYLYFATNCNFNVLS